MTAAAGPVSSSASCSFPEFVPNVMISNHQLPRQESLCAPAVCEMWASLPPGPRWKALTPSLQLLSRTHTSSCVVSKVPPCYQPVCGICLHLSILSSMSSCPSSLCCSLQTLFHYEAKAATTTEKCPHLSIVTRSLLPVTGTLPRPSPGQPSSIAFLPCQCFGFFPTTCSH